MKKLYVASIFCLMLYLPLSAQWTQVNNGLTNKNVTAMFAYIDTIMVGTENGIFKTSDDGENWQNISGNLGNLQINDIRGGGGSRVIWVASKNGLFITEDQITYSDQTSTGLTNTDINYYWFGEGENAKWAVGTNGGGLFTAPELNGPWNASSTGITGDGLYINDLSGYKDDDLQFSILATNDGFYFSTDTLTSWTKKNGTLTGDALKVNNLFVIGSLILAATDGGYYASVDLGENWIDGIIGEKMNAVGISLFGPGGFYYLLGEKGYYSLDLASWKPIDFSGVSGGEITSVAFTSKYMYIGTETEGVFRQDIGLITSIADNTNNSLIHQFQLKQNYPNPFNPKTIISYTLPVKSIVELSIYSLLGQKIETIVNQVQNTGNYQYTFNANNLPSGTYFYRLKTKNGIQTKRMIIIK